MNALHVRTALWLPYLERAQAGAWLDAIGDVSKMNYENIYNP